MDDWLRWALERLLAAFGAVAMVLSGALYRRYSSDRTMLLRHDELVREHDSELGNYRAFREQLGKGPMGEALVRQIEELKEADERLHTRVSRSNRERAKLDKQVAELANDIKWIRRHLENGHSAE